jgi:hypothetical protein
MKNWPTLLVTILRPLALRVLFVRALIQVATRPAVTAREVVRRRWPGQIGPKTFASIALAFFLAMSAVTEHMHPRWLDSYNALPLSDQEIFRNYFGLASDEIDQKGEALTPSNTLAARKIAKQTGGTSDRSIASFLEARDLAFAQRYRSAARYAHATNKILLSWSLAVGTLPMLTCGFIVVYWTCARRRLSLTTALNLSAYFNGYYLVVFALIKLLQLPTSLPGDSAVPGLERLLGDVAVTVVDLAVMTLLTIQFYKYCGQAFRCTRLRLTGGVFAAVCSTGVGVVLAVGLLLTTFSIPLIDHQLRNWG